jgi:hypothetical protein
MKVRVIKTTFRFWKELKQELLKDGDINLEVMPVKDDVVIIDDIRYKVIQRDIRMAKNNQQVTLFVEKLYQ